MTSNTDLVNALAAAIEAGEDMDAIIAEAREISAPPEEIKEWETTIGFALSRDWDTGRKQWRSVQGVLEIKPDSPRYLINIDNTNKTGTVTYYENWDEQMKAARGK